MTKRAAPSPSPTEDVNGPKSKRPKRSTSPLPSPSDACRPREHPSIDHSTMPHIFEAILDSIPLPELPALRAVSRGLRDWVDARMAEHVVLCPNDLLSDLGLGPPNTIDLNPPLTDVVAADTSYPHTSSDSANVPSSTDQGPCATCHNGDSSPLILAGTITASGTRIASAPALCRLNAEYHRGHDCPSRGHSDEAASDEASSVKELGIKADSDKTDRNEAGPLDVGSDEADSHGTADVYLKRGSPLKATTTLDVIGTSRHLEWLARALTLPIQRLRFIGEDWPSLEHYSFITAHTAVLFTRPSRRRMGSVPPEMGIQRLVVNVHIPRIERGNRNVSIWSPNSSVTATEIVYVFDPQWASLPAQWFLNPSTSSLFSDVLRSAAWSLAGTRVAFVGLDILPMPALNVVPDELTREVRNLGSILSKNMRFLELGEAILGREAIDDYWRDFEVFEWLQRLCKLAPPWDMPVDEVRRQMDKAEEAERAQRHGDAERRRHENMAQVARTFRQHVGRELKWLRRVASRGRVHPDVPNNPYQPKAEWPDERLDAFAEDNVRFYTRDEYRAYLGEEQWGLLTVGYPELTNLDL